MQHIQRLLLLSSCLLIAVMLFSCHQTPSSKDHPAENKPVKKKIDLSKPIIVFSRNTSDAVTDNDFIVKAFPSLNDKIIYLDIQYGGNEVKDSVQMLPPEYYKRIDIRPADDSNSCIFGFIDTDNQFKEMVQITGSPTSIGIKTLHEYILQ